VLKFGVTDRKRFLSLERRSRIGRLFSLYAVERAAYTMLQTPANSSAEDVQIFESLMPHVLLSAGTYRTTRRGRFRNLDPELNRIILAKFDHGMPLQVQDWAASTGLTSSEWARSLFPLFPSLTFVASDLLLFLIHLQEREGGMFVFEPEGTPLQFIKPPFVVRMVPPETWKLPVNRWLYKRAWRRWNQLSVKADARVQTWAASASEEALTFNGARYSKLSLVHPEASRLARSDSRFHLGQHSVFESLYPPVHVIRTMNIFNRAYFGEDQLKAGAAAVLNSLLPGGLWILGRTVQEQPPTHEVTVFRKQVSGLVEIVERFGRGSEIEPLVLSTSGA
jgi:hypothetical protein